MAKCERNPQGTPERKISSKDEYIPSFLHDRDEERYLGFMVRFCIFEEDNTQMNDRLEEFLQYLRDKGYSQKRITKTLSKHCNKVRFGFEVHRIIKKIKL